MCTMEIMHTMSSEADAPTPKRRNYSPALKAQVVAQCRADGASIAAVALTHGINANIVHRWLREHPAKPAPKPINPFIPLPLPAPQVEDAEAVRSAPGGCADIRVEIRRGTGVVTVNWPVEAASSCADWLRDWLR